MIRSLDILYEDDFLVAVNKPAGILSIPDRFDESKPSCLQILRNKYNDIFTVHRIDKETSGVLVFARTAEMHAALNQLFERHAIRKIYFALVEGRFTQEKGMIDKPIAADPQKPGKMKVHPKGKPSQTSYTVLEQFKGYSWMEIELHTGRTHQIRVHMASECHPLAVDSLYGRRTSLSITDIKSGVRLGWGEPRPLIERCTLHAASLTFVHPQTKKELHIEAPLSKDLKATLNQLRKL
jgi:23S rRNA pseudouridine1911/1915/1917 synthase